MHSEDMCNYGMFEHIKEQRDEAHMAYHLEHNEDTVKPMGTYRIISTHRALCKSLLYEEII